MKKINNLNYEMPRLLTHSNMIKIFEGIYLYKNVLPKNVQDEYLLFLNSLSEKEWRQHGNYKINDLPDDSFAIDKVSPYYDKMEIANDIILEISAPEYWTVSFNFANRLRVGDKQDIHEGNFLHHKKEFNLDYVATLPFGNWVGGNVFFPEKNIEVEVKSGDLLIFNADYRVGIRDIENGIRYSNLVYLIKIPARQFI